MERFPDCAGLIHPLRMAGASVEQTLARFQRQATEFQDRYRHLAAIRFYLQAALLECENCWRHRHFGLTNYAMMLDRIEH
jgi:hypothetical protein